MLKLINTCTSFETTNVKCAEVFCQNSEDFSIVCVHCAMKTYDFCDFLLHFKNMHWQKSRTELPAHKDDVDVLHEQNTAKICEVFVKSNNKPDELYYKEQESMEGTVNETSLEGRVNDFDECNSSDNKHEEDVPRIPNQQWQMENNTAGILSCRHCQQQFKNLQAFNTHLLNEHGEYPCSDCDKVYKSKDALHTHQYNHTGIRRFRCDYEKCEKTFFNPKQLSTHKRFVHVLSTHTPDTLSCKQCNQRFEELRTYNTHLLREHGGYPCPDCDKVYKSKDALHTHQYNHTGVRRFRCDYENCNKAFFNPKQLSTHKRVVHVMPANFVCEICGYRTKNITALTVHMRYHTGERPYKCDTCGKGFASPSLLSDHRPIHSSERPHKCEVCGAAFSRPKALYHHKHLHLAVKKYVCKLCSKDYAQASGLSNHMKRHKTYAATSL